MTELTTATIRASAEVELPLLSMVRELLRNTDVQSEDDFFLAGGYSLLGTRLVIRARKAFGVKLALHDLFDAGTVARLAVRIEELILEEIDSLPAETTAYATEEGRV